MKQRIATLFTGTFGRYWAGWCWAGWCWAGWCWAGWCLASGAGCGNPDCPSGRVVSDDLACVCAEGFIENDDGVCVRAETGAGSEMQGPTGPPPDVTARFPWNGYATGSVHAGGSAARNPLRPKFVWNEVQGAALYQLQVDDECALTSFRDCDFPSPEIDDQATGQTHTLSEDLPVSMEPPVGRRYYWRVRACASESECSAWTEVRYLNVGRLDSDYNGDGYSDVLVGAPDVDVSSLESFGFANMYLGNAGSIDAESDAEYGDVVPSFFGLFGSTVTSVGDVNADGYADAAISGFRDNSSDAGRVHVMFGSRSGLQDESRTVISAPTPQFGDSFATSISLGGDINGDGFSDFLVGASGLSSGAEREGGAYIFWGSADGVDVEGAEFLDSPNNAPQARFGFEVDVAGDVNGDGYHDFVVITRDGPEAHLYLGGRDLGGSARSLEPLHSLEPEEGIEGSIVDARVDGQGDINGDGFADVALGIVSSVTRAQIAQVHVFLGDQTPRAIADRSLEYLPSVETSFGGSLATGDLNGDGVDDLVVGARRAPEAGRSGAGAAVIYFGAEFAQDSASSWGTEPIVFGSIQPMEDARFATALSTGDTNGDGFSDLIVGSSNETEPGRPETHGFARVFPGSAEGLSKGQFVSLINPYNDTLANFGKSVR